MKKIIKEFKEFAVKGNVIDMAVGLVIGSAFTAIVTALTQNIFLPIISIITGGIDYSAWNITVGTGENAPVIGFGTLASAIVTFIVVALAMFILIKGINRLRKPKEEPAPKRKCPYCCSEIADEATRCPHCTSVLESAEESTEE